MKKKLFWSIFTFILLILFTIGALYLEGKRTGNLPDDDLSAIHMKLNGEIPRFKFR